MFDLRTTQRKDRSVSSSTSSSSYLSTGSVPSLNIHTVLSWIVDMLSYFEVYFYKRIITKPFNIHLMGFSLTNFEYFYKIAFDLHISETYKYF